MKEKTLTKWGLNCLILRAKIIAFLHGADLYCNERNFVAPDKLDCIWYSDIPFAELHMKGYALTFMCTGDVRADIQCGSEALYYTDKENMGAEYAADNTFRTCVSNDAAMQDMIAAGQLTFRNNKWIEVGFQTVEGTWLYNEIADCFTLFDCLSHISYWCKHLKKLVGIVKQNYKAEDIETVYGEEVQL